MRGLGELEMAGGCGQGDVLSVLDQDEGQDHGRGWQKRSVVLGQGSLLSGL
jgi:hypothetical protein